MSIQLSYSKVKALEFCPWKYKLIYIDNLHSAPTPQSSFGHSIHRALELYYKESIKTFEKLIDCFNLAWKNEGFLTPVVAQEYYERGEKLLLNFWNEESKLTAQSIFAEKNFSFNIGDIEVVGIIDRVDKLSDESYDLIEYKTHYKRPTDEQLKKDFQLLFYKFACKNALSFDPNRLTYYFLSENVKVNYDFSGFQEDFIAKKIEAAAKIVSSQDFFTCTQNCSYCEYRKLCKKSVV